MKMLVVLLALCIAIAAASDLQPDSLAFKLSRRDLTCGDVNNYYIQDPSGTTAFCRNFLQILPKTVISTSTTTRATVTVAVPTYTTTVVSVTPNGLTKSFTKTTLQSVSFTPGTVTLTSTITSTAYLDPTGSTITVLKKRNSPTPVHGELVARAIPTPVWLQGLSKIQISAACQCLNLATPTYTLTRNAAVTSTATVALQRKIIKTTTLAPVTTSVTATTTKSVTITLAAPKATTTTVQIDTVNGCPPTSTTTWVCPDGTGADDGSDPNYENCPIVAADEFSGYCLYWADDGSPAGSTLVLGDGSGDPANDQTREAVYGNDPSDDCPAWADWTCTPNPNKRSSLEYGAFEHELTKRGYIPKKLTPAQHKKLGLKKPPKGLVRGGKYVPYTGQT